MRVRTNRIHETGRTACGEGGVVLGAQEDGVVQQYAHQQASKKHALSITTSTLPSCKLIASFPGHQQTQGGSGCYRLDMHSRARGLAWRKQQPARAANNPGEREVDPHHSRCGGRTIEIQASDNYSTPSFPLKTTRKRVPKAPSPINVP